jgi:hypothetical protein
MRYVTPLAFSSLMSRLLSVHIDPHCFRYITHFGGKQC